MFRTQAHPYLLPVMIALASAALVVTMAVTAVIVVILQQNGIAPAIAGTLGSLADWMIWL